ncbi:MAG: nicotinamide-nucleotide amidohydrolase family protein [Clostridia bacterium]|nr:nicotinamide-nucleotide amidohydrolase family protein [Clostridia bacterium]
MKTAFLTFGDFDVSRVKNSFEKNGINLSTAQVLSPDDDIGFRRAYEIFRDTADALIIADGAAFDLKETLAEFSDLSLVENENARSVIEKQGLADFSGAMMPAEATLIPNERGAYQGFALDEREFTLMVLPCGEDFFPACEKYAMPYLTAKTGVSKTLIFKCFGAKSDLEQLLDAVKQNYGFRYAVKDEYNDLTVSVFFEETIADYRTAVREIAFAIKDACYADYDTTLSETLFTLLKLGGKKISVAESFTGGGVAREIVKNAGVSEYFYEGVVAYSNQSKIKRLGVPESDITESGAVSAKTAYKMAAGLLKEDCDVAVATTGLAGPDGDGTNPVGLCFIAAGTKNGIHVYRFRFSGDRKSVTKKGINAALFSAVKILKNAD